ncbi:GtrA family protein [Gilvimarinus algae]|uniref:GtrA family protein n=1 Tax=Gilvimarinus algae TaxID=3058037 RepID=A0ABT8TIN0_9GAMM|nr:GtrA family protein [Gilvimarinus sp. SDUM040014]MDO3383943.1 GtrA family protein [Gilvimarinus sp. SDUM040014]
MSETSAKTTNGRTTSVGQWLHRLYRLQFGRFLLVGGAATVLQYLLLILLVELTILPNVAASAAAFTLSAVFNYLANYYFTFQATQKHSESALRFAVTVAIGLGLNTAVFYLADMLMPHYVLAQMLATAVTLVSNFLLHKFWIYR